MKKLSLLFLLFLGVAAFMQSCDNSKTYAEMKDDERDAINAWILKNEYEIISEKEFYAQDTITKGDQFVLFEESGVYMNVVCLGPEGDNGTRLGDGYHTILSHVVELAMQTRDAMFEVGDTLFANMNVLNTQYTMYPEEYKLTISGNSYSASFINSRENGMYATYGTASVPSGWLVPLKYIKPGRTQSAEKVARVRLIVPHGQGTSQAAQYVYPCFYELTYNLAR
ncbi:DUF4827 domain-containing protein [uncultured Bacteroides sp.]|uniref:DUF4827 domain-containing protein n=1 Tax=uncultured Bacteroides sp. TaxID=162156 RepID=UPI0026164557|nr:DUF4827 domain-containing protein [uncultured Bacteroides sp.]